MPAGRARRLNGVIETCIRLRFSPNTSFGSAHTKVWGEGGLIATSLQPLLNPTAAVDAHARVEQPKRRARSQR
ncbi:hypothetical protein HaLaN_29123 [Haematococcus lacustris]|uniref:Uncharacterized protein n=1 Tax=Haematococcus lacustris TaxID=44745 RepID=A0A6A0AEK2_HAELA|nr:hypothetical protein HaLaN_29123 [Haematococcus lacustris]